MHNKLFILCGLFLSILLSGCSSEEIFPGEGDGSATGTNPSSIHNNIVFGVHTHGEEALAWKSEGGLRARARASRAAEEGDLAATYPDQIGVWGFNHLTTGHVEGQGYGMVFLNQKMYYKYGPTFLSGATNILSWYDDNDWVYEPVKPWVVDEQENEGVLTISAAKYKFYAYAPWCRDGDGMGGGAAADETYQILTFRSYEGIKMLEWNNVPRYSGEDYMYSDRILAYESKTGLERNDVQTFSMRHLQARLRFRYRLGNTFASIRTIRLKKMELLNTRGKNVNVIIDFSTTLNAEASCYDITRLIVSENATLQRQTIIPLQNENAIPYLDLTKSNNATFQAFANLYVIPIFDTFNLTFRLTYDVYDGDVLVRANETATNDIPLNFYAGNYDTDPETVTDGKRYLWPGYYYDINITIEPDYLYVLTDADANRDEDSEHWVLE